MGLSALLGLAAFYLVTELLLFHCILQYKGLSTYDYIISQSNKSSHPHSAAKPAINVASPAKSEVEHPLDRLAKWKPCPAKTTSPTKSKVDINPWRALSEGPNEPQDYASVQKHYTVKVPDTRGPSASSRAVLQLDSADPEPGIYFD